MYRMETLKRHVLSLGEKEYMSLKEIVVTFEEKIYYAAKSQISSKMLTLDTRSRNLIQPNPASC